MIILIRFVNYLLLWSILGFFYFKIVLSLISKYVYPYRFEDDLERTVNSILLSLAICAIISSITVYCVKKVFARIPKYYLENISIMIISLILLIYGISSLLVNAFSMTIQEDDIISIVNTSSGVLLVQYNSTVTDTLNPSQSIQFPINTFKSGSLFVTDEKGIIFFDYLTYKNEMKSSFDSNGDNHTYSAKVILDKKNSYSIFPLFLVKTSHTFITKIVIDGKR